MYTIKDYEKNPNSTEDFYILWDTWLGTDTILNSTWVVPSGLTQTDAIFDDTRTVVWLQGGTERDSYKVINHVTTANGREQDATLIISITDLNNVEFLIPYLRLRLGDIDCESYRYSTEWLHRAIDAAIQVLGRWWNYKYLLDTEGDVYRNPNGYFVIGEPPLLEGSDAQIIVLMAAYITLEGSLENSAWDFVSWRDAELAYSNLESSRARNSNLQRIWDELVSTLKVPQKRLARALKMSLPGYKTSTYEHEGI
jgi:hypothetical protein